MAIRRSRGSGNFQGKKKIMGTLGGMEGPVDHSRESNWIVSSVWRVGRRGCARDLSPHGNEATAPAPFPCSVRRCRYVYAAGPSSEVLYPYMQDYSSWVV